MTELDTIIKTITSEPVSVAALSVLVLFTIITVNLHIRLHRLTRGARAQNLEGIINELKQRTQIHTTTIASLHSAIEKLTKNITHAICGVGLVRFNALPGEGGNQSFALALIDHTGNGVLISALSTRGNTRLWVKPLQNGTSPINLSQEEEKAISFAKNNLASQSRSEEK